MGDVVVIEAAEDVNNGICLADVGKEFIAQAFTLGGAFDETCDVDNLYCSGYYRAGITHLDELGQAIVGYGYDAHVGLDCAEGKVC